MIQPQQVKRQLALVVTTLALLSVWLLFLPAYANRPAVKEHLQWLDEKGIDPSAMYYTELEVMEKILARQRSNQNRH
ncbi:hypothetical protein [Thalassoglobus sp.]|uniref:hypothetical protein n=1 Tax=Thalassoglobus sp. TaxID=2795869 RepID=UPI003AA9049D